MAKMKIAKPSISAEARERILGFVNAVESLQVTYGITIFADEDTISLRDEKRKDDWVMSDGTVYGQWDAQFFGTNADHTQFVGTALEFEDFDGWDK